MKKKILFLFPLLFIACSLYSQIDVSLYEQFNGHYDFTFVGNTLNETTNRHDDVLPPCTILTTSSEMLELNPGDNIIKAYLYWAGSGEGDFAVKLNGQDITAERTFALSRDTNENGVIVTRHYFSAFADVTALVQATGPALYTLSELDLTTIINGGTTTNLYCRNGTNFSGWAIVVVYENPALPLNQLNLYDGFEIVPDQIAITLNSLNVVDNVGAKIGFLAWEGDATISVTEELRINGELVSAEPLNPDDNAFNSTNTVTDSDELYNMDLDIYNFQNYINIGDATAEITLESGQDMVIVNAIITKLNSQLPDATIAVDNIAKECNSNTLEVSYTVFNVNSTDPLPAGTPIAIYLNGSLIGTAQTQAEIAIGGSESGSITLNLPTGTPLDFELIFVVDDDGTGNGTVTETDEGNNTFLVNDTLLVSPPLQDPADVTACDTGAGLGIFDFSGYEESLKNTDTDSVTFYPTEAQAIDGGDDNITNTSAYPATSNPQEIFVRLEDENGCFAIGSFLLITEDCQLPDATVVIEEVFKQCNSRVIHVHYTVNNFNSFDVLPAGTPVSIYVNGEFLDYTEALQHIPVGGFETGYITLTIPIGIPLDFDLTFVADDTGNGTGIVVETDETNNAHTLPTSLILSPVLQQPEDIVSCDTGLGRGSFDFSHYAEELQNYDNETVTFYTSQQNADQDLDRIYNTSQYTITENPQLIFVRLDNGTCHTTASFLLRAERCPPTVYNYVTPNGDGYNDTFFVEGLRNVFLNFKMSIYNRWGNLVWTGRHSDADWDAIATVEKVGPEGTTVPVGTYYYVLELNDPGFPEPLVGWVYVSK